VGVGGPANEKSIESPESKVVYGPTYVTLRVNKVGESTELTIVYCT
jgi:hypothetical protein